MKEESKLSLLLTSFLLLVLGITLIIATEELLISVNYVLVCIFAIIGVIQIISFFFNRGSNRDMYGQLLLGTVFIWVAIFIYIYYTMIIIILPIIMGVILLVKYFNMKEITKTKYKRYLLLSLVSFVLGILLIVKPKLTIYTYFKITGVYIIIVAISYFMECLILNKNK